MEGDNDGERLGLAEGLKEGEIDGLAEGEIDGLSEFETTVIPFASKSIILSSLITKRSFAVDMFQ